MRPPRTSPQENRRVADWSRLACGYDWQLPLERPALAAALDLADACHDDTLLDLGTGTGGLLRELAARPDYPRLAIGLDESAAMLERAEALPQSWSLESGDARRLRFADGAFSIVTAAYLLHVVDPGSRRQIVAEARRVLRPGGRLVVVTPTWPRTRLARMLYKAAGRPRRLVGRAAQRISSAGSGPAARVGVVPSHRSKACRPRVSLDLSGGDTMSRTVARAHRTC